MRSLLILLWCVCLLPGQSLFRAAGSLGSGGGGGTLPSATANNKTNFGSGVALVDTLPSTPAVGSTVILTVYTGTSTAPLASCSDNQSPSNTYSQAVSAYLPGGASAAMQTFVAYVAHASGAFTITCPENAGGFLNLNWVVGEYSNILSISPGYSPSNNSGIFVTSVNCGTVTTTATDLVYAAWFFAGGTPVAGSGFTIPSGVSGGNTASEYAVGAAGAYSPAVGASTSTNMFCMAMAFKGQ